MAYVPFLSSSLIDILIVFKLLVELMCIVFYVLIFIWIIFELIYVWAVEHF
jgi:hypothetical protein